MRRESYRGASVCSLRAFSNAQRRVVNDIDLAGSYAFEFWQEPMLEHLLRHQTPFDALALEFYRFGFFVLVTGRKMEYDAVFASFARKILVEIKSSPFCTLSMLEGCGCSECVITKEKLFRPRLGSLIRDLTFGNCLRSPQYELVAKGVESLETGASPTVSGLGTRIREARIIFELKKLEKSLFNKKAYMT